MEDCIFCKITKGDIPCHKIWENDKHIAFLSIFPNTPGFTVVATKKHYTSYAFEQDDKVYIELLEAAKEVGKLLDKKLEDVGRTGLILEGMGVNHLHAKLFPLHGTADMEWKPMGSKNMVKFFEKYPGYISSHDSLRADDKELAKLAEKIRN